MDVAYLQTATSSKYDPLSELDLRAEAERGEHDVGCKDAAPFGVRSQLHSHHARQLQRGRFWGDESVECVNQLGFIWHLIYDFHFQYELEWWSHLCDS